MRYEENLTTCYNSYRLEDFEDNIFIVNSKQTCYLATVLLLLLCQDCFPILVKAIKEVRGLGDLIKGYVYLSK